MLCEDFSEIAPGELVEVSDRYAQRGLAFLPDDLPPQLNLSSEVRAKELTGLGKRAANALVKYLVEDGVLIEVTGQQRNQVFFAPEIARASMGLADQAE